MSEGSSDSESCPSFLTESESEHESTYGEEKEQKEVDYLATAKEIICENVNITTENALKLNSGYHNMLKILKNKLEILLVQCQDRQVEIAKQIDEYKSNKKPLVGKSRTSGYICGQPYFKDEDLYPGPHNDDYLHRKNVLKEFFPLDMFESTDSNWTVKDKLNILKGVKLQIIEFIERENRLKTRRLGNGLEAERLRLETESLKKRDVNDLWEKVKRFANDYPGQKFEIDWMRISNIEINGRHAVAACVGLWNNYMLPGLVRDAWKAEEESVLLDAVERNGCQDWAQIASEVPGRSPYQCFVHFQTTFSPLAQIKRERWTPEEDALLVQVVDENRIGKNIVWNKVVENMPLRNKIQCYNRYMFTLMRPTKHTKFTPEEDCIILAYVQQCGDDFRFVPANLLPGRSNRQIWARYNHTLKYVNKHAGWTIEEDIRLMNFIKENLTDEGPRKISWAACSKALGNHSRLSCRTRYYTIEKFLEKNPDATLDDVPRKGKKLSSSVTDENWMKTFINIRNEAKDAQSAEAKEEPSTSGTVQVTKRPRTKRKPKVDGSKVIRTFSDNIKCVIKKKLYNKFKYSFHYQFGEQTPAIQNSKIFCLNKAIFHLLNCTTNFDRISDYMDNFTPNEQVLLQKSLSIRLNPCLKNFLSSAAYCFLLPPNYNTVLGLRGVVLNASYPSEPSATDKEVNSALAETHEASYRFALDNFRDRFRMLFYWTMLLVQQNPAEATFTDTDEPQKQEDYSSIEQEQITLERLAKHCQQKRQHKFGYMSDESRNQAADCLPSPPNQTVIQPPPPNVEVISVQRITTTASELIPAEPPQPQFSAVSTVAPCLSPPITVPIVEQQPPAPYRVKYSILPEQVHLFDPSSPLYGQAFAIGAEKEPSSMDFVTHITIINPEDLPTVVQTTSETEPAELPLEIDETGGLQVARTAECNEISEQLFQNDKEQSCREVADSEPVTQEATDRTDLTSELVPVAEIDELPINEINEKTLDDVPPAYKDTSQWDSDVIPQVSNKDAESISNEDAEPQLDPPEVVSDHPFEDYTDSYADDVDTSQDHHSDVELSGIADSSNSSAIHDVQSTVEQLNPFNSTHITNVTNVGDFVIQELQETDCLSRTRSDDLDVAKSHVALDSFEEEQNPESIVDPDWNPKLCDAPRRTYSRSTIRMSSRSDASKQQQLRSVSHAWRWVHVDKSNREDVELHRSLWQACDPIRMQFQATLANEDSCKIELVIPKIDEVIVIDDDEVEIKDEPVDCTETQVENTVDEACIQQIIETASNILQLSKEFKIGNLNHVESAQPSVSAGPTELPVFFEPYSDEQTGSLIIQTPSRVFDEQYNCYFYVDEIQDVPSLMRSTQSLEHRPLQNMSFHRGDSFFPSSNLDTVQFEAPRRILTPAQDPQTPSTSRTVTPYQSPAQVKTYTGKPKPSKSNKVETKVLQQTSVDKPRIRVSKRPPRDKSKSSPQQQHCIQNQALSLLDALFKQPRLTPTRQQPLSAATSMTSISSYNSDLPTLAPSKQPNKRIKLETTEESQSEEQVEMRFNAVDVISMLANEEAGAEDDVVDEDESAFLAQLAAETPSKSLTMPLPIKEEDRSTDLLFTAPKTIQSTAKRRRVTRE